LSSEELLIKTDEEKEMKKIESKCIVSILGKVESASDLYIVRE